MKKILLIMLIALSSCQTEVIKDKELIKPIEKQFKTTTSLTRQTGLFTLVLQDGYLPSFKGKYYIPASGSAVLLYKNIKDYYEFSMIKVVLKLKGNVVFKNSYKTSELDLILNREKLINTIYSKILKSDGEGLFYLFDDDVKKKTAKKSIIQALKKLDSTYGKPLSIETFGYAGGLVDLKDKELNVVRVFANIERDSISTKLGILINEDTGGVYNISFDW